MKKTFCVFLLIITVLALTCVLFACGDKKNNASSTYIISFNTNGGSKVESISLKSGSPITLPEAPTRDGYIFTGWFLDNKFETAVNPAIFKVRGSITIFACWESVETYRHYITISPDLEQGEMKILSPKPDDDGNVRAVMGETVTVYITPFAGYEVVENSVFASDVQLENVSLNTFTFIMPPKSVEITAEFDNKPMRIQALQNFENGSVVLSHDTAKAGELVNVYAVPDFGYRLKELYLIDSSSVVEGSGKLSIMASSNFIMGYNDVLVVAEFEEIDYSTEFKVNIAETIGGNVVLNKDSSPAGLFIHVDFVPNEDYRFKDYTVYGENGIANYIYTYDEGFIMPDEDVTLRANFVRILQSDSSYEVKVAENEFGSVVITDNRLYKEGEEVCVQALPFEGYALKNIYVNGSLILSNVFSMPAQTATVSAEFVKKGHEINVIATNCAIALSHQTAYAGEYVHFKVVENQGFNLAPNRLTLNGEIISGDYFIMPDEEVTLSALAFQSTATYQINVDNTLNGSLLLNTANASIYDVIEITPIAMDGYRFKEGSLEITYTLSGVKETKPLKGLKFSMIDANVTVSGKFERVYTALSTDNGAIGFYASRDNIALNETIWFDIVAHASVIENSIEANVVFGSYIEKLNSSHSFTLTDEKLRIAGENPTLQVQVLNYNQINTASVNYAIKIAPSTGGKIYLTDGTSSKQYGNYVKLSVDADEGYRLKNIMLSTLQGDYYEVSDTFIMPSSTVTLEAVFEKDEEKGFSLEEQYYQNVANFHSCGLEVTYYREKYQLIDDYPSLKNNVFLNYFEGAVCVKAEYGHDFYIIEVNDISHVTPISHEAHAFIADNLDVNKEDVNVQINYNYIVLSVGGSAEEDFYVYKNGVKAIGDYVIYERNNGTYGVFAYLGNGGYISIPSDYNGRSISYFSGMAFKKPEDILGVKLANITEIGDFAFENTSITYLELGSVEKLGTGVFKNTSKLKGITVMPFNKYFHAISGVLYQRGNTATSIIYLYPQGKSSIDGTFTLPTQTKEIAPYAFYKTSLKTVSYGGALIRIGDFAFANSSLENFKYTETPSAIGVVDFSIDTVNKSAVAYIGSGAFKGASALNSFYLDSIKEIGEYAIDFDGIKTVLINLPNEDNGVINAHKAPIGIEIEGNGGTLKINAPIELKALYESSAVWSYLIEYFNFI